MKTFDTVSQTPITRLLVLLHSFEDNQTIKVHTSDLFRFERTFPRKKKFFKFCNSLIVRPYAVARVTNSVSSLSLISPSIITSEYAFKYFVSSKYSLWELFDLKPYQLIQQLACERHGFRNFTFAKRTQIRC
jgi:hypothetical protein